MNKPLKLLLTLTFLFVFISSSFVFSDDFQDASAEFSHISCERVLKDISETQGLLITTVENYSVQLKESGETFQTYEGAEQPIYKVEISNKSNGEIKTLLANDFIFDKEGIPYFDRDGGKYYEENHPYYDLEHPFYQEIGFEPKIGFSPIDLNKIYISFFTKVTSGSDRTYSYDIQSEKLSYISNGILENILTGSLSQTIKQSINLNASRAFGNPSLVGMLLKDNVSGFLVQSKVGWNEEDKKVWWVELVAPDGKSGVPLCGAR